MTPSSQHPPAVPAPIGPRHRRVLAVAAVLVLLLHALVIGGTPWPGAATGALAAGPIFSVRTLAAEARAPEPVPAAPAGPGEPLPAAVPAEAPNPARAAAAPAEAPTPARAVAARRSAAVRQPAERAPAEPPVPAVPSVPGAAAASDAVAAAVPVAVAASAVPGDRDPALAPGPLLAAGEAPPPTYRHQLPPPATLRYEVRRGALRGSGEIRWRPGEGGYELAFEARIGGLTLLSQTSEGGIDVAGLAPTRFVDRRMRRQAQAANFQRDRGTITFSGPKAEWPLLAGSQDRLSWMLQLAAIVTAEPERLVEGGRIAMVVVGARGAAAVWVLRYAGQEDIETASGTVRAAKFVRDARSTYDTMAEIWLDPARAWLPAQLSLRNAAGVSEYDLLLESVSTP